jgi:TRAP-type uncharacterized transport system substrate-binding protein
MLWVKSAALGSSHSSNRQEFVMASKNRLLMFIGKWVVPAAALAALALAAFLYFHSPAPKTYRLSLTAGNPLGVRHQLAERLQKEGSAHGLEFTLEPSKGSEQSLDWVNSRKVDVALVQGGLSTEGRPNVRQVATLHIEPMHLVVKKELAPNGSFSLLALRRKTIDLEQVGSGTHSLAAAILEFIGLQPRDRDPVNGYTPVSLDRQKLWAEQDTSRLPDAVFLVSSLPAITVRYLVTRHGYRVVPLPFAEALALKSLEKAGEEERRPTSDGQIVLGRIQATTIPAFTYSIEPPVPDKPLPTLGTRLLLVAHKDVPKRAAFQLVEQVYGFEFGQVEQPPLDARLLDLPPEFPWHDGSLLYQERNSPLLSGAVMDSVHKGATIFAAAASGLFVLWQWSKLRGSVARDKGFKDFFNQVARIEQQVVAADGDAAPSRAELLALRERLSTIKLAALDEFAQSEVAGKDLLYGFLLQVNDVRDQLTRLIHERTGTETQLPVP